MEKRQEAVHLTRRKIIYALKELLSDFKQKEAAISVIAVWCISNGEASLYDNMYGFCTSFLRIVLESYSL